MDAAAEKMMDDFKEVLGKLKMFKPAYEVQTEETEILFDGKPVIVPCVNVDGVTVTPGEYKVRTIKGEITVWGYVVEGVTHFYGSDVEPPGDDIVDIGTYRNLGDALTAVVTQFVKQDVENACLDFAVAEGEFEG